LMRRSCQGENRGVLISYISAIDIDGRIGVQSAIIDHLEIGRGDEDAGEIGDHLMQGMEGCAEPDKDGRAIEKDGFERRDELLLDAQLGAVALGIGVARDAGGGEGATETFDQKTSLVEELEVASNGLSCNGKLCREIGDGGGAIGADSSE